MRIVIKKSKYGHVKGGRRKDLNNQYFRTSWEANIARLYNHLRIRWEYEPKTFYFDGIRRGSVSYTPDFHLVDQDKWIEVKGHLDQKGKTKLKRFKKYYPEEFKKLEIIDEDRYRAISRQMKYIIDHWE